MQARQGHQRRRHALGVAGIERDERLVRRDRPRVVAERSIADLGDVLPQRQRHREIATDRGRGRVERGGRVVPAIVGRGQPQDRRLGLGRSGVGREGLGPGLERRAPELELALLDVRDATEQVRGVGADRGLALHPQHAAQIFPQPIADVERLEDPRHPLPQRRIDQQLLEQLATVGVARLRRDDLFEQIDRAGAIVERAGVQLGATEPQRDVLAGRRPAQLRRQHAVELAPALAVGVEPLERLVRRQVPGLELEDAAVIVHRAPRIAQHVLVERGQLDQRRHPHRRRRRHRHPSFEQRAQIVPPRGAAVERRERGERLVVLGLELEHREPRLLGAALGLGIARHAVREIDRHRAQLRRRRAGLALRRQRLAEDRRQLAGPAELVGQRGQRRARRAVSWRRRDHPGRGVPRARRRTERVIERYQLPIERARRVRRQRRVARQTFEARDQRHRLLAALEVWTQLRRHRAPHVVGDRAGPRAARQVAHARRDQRRRRRRQPGQRRAVVPERLGRSIEAAVGQGREPQLELRALEPRRRGELRREHRRQRVPVAARLVQPRQRRQRHRVARHLAEDLLLGLGRRVEIGEPLFLDLGHATEEAAPRGPGRRVRLSPQRREQLGPVGELLRQPLDRRLGVVVGRRQRADALIHLARLGRVVELVAVDRRQRAQEPQPHVRRHRRLAGRIVGAGALERRRHLAPVLRHLGQPHQLGGQRRILGRQLEGAHRPRQRQRARTESRLAQRSDLGDLRQLRRASVGVREQDLVHRQEPRRLVGLQVRRHQRPRRRHVGRLDRQHALPHPRRALGLLPRRRHRRRPPHHRQPRHAIVGAIGQADHRLDQLVPLAEPAVEPLEAVPVARRRVQLAQRAQRLAVARLDREDPRERLRRQRRRAHAIGQERALLLEERHRLRRRRRAQPLPAEDLGQRRVALLALVQRRERRVGLAEPVVRRAGPDDARLGQRRVVDLDRQARVTDALGRQPRHLAALGAPLDADQRLGLDAEQPDELPPLTPSRVDVLQLRQRRGIAGVELEQALERTDRLGVVAEALDPQLGGLAQDRGARRHRQARQLGLAREHADQVLPPPHRAVLRGEFVDRARILGIEPQDRVVGVEHHRIEPQLVGVDRDDLVEPLDLGRDLGLGQPLDLLLDEIEERVPLLGLAVEATQRLAGLGRRGIRAQELLPRVDGLVGRASGLLRQPGDLGGQRPRAGVARGVGAQRRQRLLGLAQDRHQLGALTAPAVIRAVEVERHRVRGVELADAAEVVLGGVGVAEALPQDHADLQQHAQIAVAAADPQRAGVEHHQRLPVLGARERIAEHAQRGRLRGVDRDDLLVMLERALGLIERPSRHVAQREQRRDALLAGRRQIDPLRQRGRQLGPARGAGQHALEVRRRAPVARIGLERAAQVALDLGGLGRVARVDLGGREIERGRELAIGRGLGLVDVLGRELLPVVARERERGERVGGVGVAGPLGQGRLVARGRAAFVEQILVEDLGLGDQQLDAARAAAAAQLGVDQRQRDVGPPAIAEPLSRVRQRGGGVGVEAARGCGGDLRQPSQHVGIVGIAVEAREDRLEIGHGGGGRPTTPAAHAGASLARRCYRQDRRPDNARPGVPRPDCTIIFGPPARQPHASRTGSAAPPARTASPRRLSAPRWSGIRAR